MKRLVIFMATLVLGFAGFYLYDRFESKSGSTDHDSLTDSSAVNLHIQEITPDMDLDTRLKFWSEHFANDMSNELMISLAKGQSSELSCRVRSLNYNEKMELCTVEVYASWLEKINSESSFFEVVIKTEFNLKSKTVKSSKLNANEPFNALVIDKEFDFYIEQSSVRSLQYLQEII